MGWRQQELEEMRSAAKRRFRQSRPSSCGYCGRLIKSDMYRHIWTWSSCGGARYRGAPSGRARLRTVWITCAEPTMSACLEKFLPPWTVSRKVWSDALSAQHSGISTDVLLFSDIHMSLVHHYRIHKRGLPHIAFRKNYLSQLRALLPSPVTLPPARVVSPDSSGSESLHPVDSPEVVLGPARTTRRAHRRRRPVHVEEPAVVSVPVLTIQDPLAAAGAVVLDCRPPIDACLYGH